MPDWVRRVWAQDAPRFWQVAQVGLSKLPDFSQWWRATRDGFPVADYWPEQSQATVGTRFLHQLDYIVVIPAEAVDILAPRKRALVGGELHQREASDPISVVVVHRLVYAAKTPRMAVDPAAGCGTQTRADTEGINWRAGRNESLDAFLVQVTGDDDARGM